eukprot:2138472-Prymnesium_polylepis.1
MNVVAHTNLSPHEKYGYGHRSIESANWGRTGGGAARLRACARSRAAATAGHAGFPTPLSESAWSLAGHGETGPQRAQRLAAPGGAARGERGAPAGPPRPHHRQATDTRHTRSRATILLRYIQR